MLALWHLFLSKSRSSGTFLISTCDICC